MFSLLLAIIYMAFISLGLPDSLLGAAWPTLQVTLSVPLSYAGIVTMLISLFTIFSSLNADRVIYRFGTGLVTACSVLLTALALLGFSFATEFWMLCILAIPYGLGAGAIDAALNNYVALHYSSRQMSWLHAFWGVGVTISPYIMSFCLTRDLGWEMGYRTVSVIQMALTALMFLTLPLWKRKNDPQATAEETQTKVLSLSQIFRLKGAAYILLAFFCYCALESTAGLWASSYMAEYRGVDPDTAARFAALFYLGITLGRVANGFIADRFGDRTMIRVGILTMLSGIALILLPLPVHTPALAGLVIVGLGAAPVYPCIIHSTPVNFGKENSQSMVGIQMACAYTGSLFMPPLFGLIAQYIHMSLYPVYLGIFALVMLIMTERLNRITGKP